MKRVAGSRWVSVVSVVVLSVAAGGVLTSSAESSSGASSVLVPITPCRLMDTRVGAGVGPRTSPIGAGETYAPLVWGSNGNCTIPVSATAVSMNVTFVNPTGQSYLTVYPPDAAFPITSNLNWVQGQAPAPNAVTVRLSADGRVGFYNFAGTVDLIADIVGYYEPSTAGPPGPAGPAGPAGPTGLTGPAGSTGAVGPVGPVGSTGAVGPVGPKGSTGAAGPVGPQGVAGADGRTVLSGQGKPDETMGVDGDFYIDLEKWTIFGPKDHGAWAEPTELIGPQGPIGPTGATGATGATGPTGPAGAPGPRPAHVIWVATSGGDFTSVAAALASITENSSTSRYLIKVAPGTYTEPDGISLKNYVDVEGSGQDTTTITCVSCQFTLFAEGSLTSEVRHLTISNPDVAGTGIRTSGVGAGVSFTHITTTGVHAGLYNYSSSPVMNFVTAGGGYAVYNEDSSPLMNFVTASSGYAAVYNDASSPTMNNVTATGWVGVLNEYGSSPTIRNSVITGSNYVIDNQSESTAKVSNSILSGNPSGTGFVCAATFIASTLVPATCPA